MCTGAYPEVDGHPGHPVTKGVYKGDYQLNVERTNNTVDRLILTDRKYTATEDKKKGEIKVKITANVEVLSDVH
jgi:hypothetical protein